MDPRERLDDAETGLMTMLHGHQAQIWTGFPGIIKSFDAEKMTCEVQPAIQGVQTKKDGSTAAITMPKLLDCPVFYPSGGGVTLTMPIKEGDECWVSLANRCIDAWWQSGGVQPQMEHRMHDLSDGFVFVGVWSQPNVLSDISTSTAQLRSNDGATFVELDPEGQIVTITAPGGLTINADVTLNGDMTQTGDTAIDGDLSNTGDVSLSGGGPAIARVGDPVSGGVITGGSSSAQSG